MTLCKYFTPKMCGQGPIKRMMQKVPSNSAACGVYASHPCSLWSLGQGPLGREKPGSFLSEVTGSQVGRSEVKSMETLVSPHTPANLSSQKRLEAKREITEAK